MPLLHSFYSPKFDTIGEALECFCQPLYASYQASLRGASISDEAVGFWWACYTSPMDLSDFSSMAERSPPIQNGGASSLIKGGTEA